MFFDTTLVSKNVLYYGIEGVVAEDYQNKHRFGLSVARYITVIYMSKNNGYHPESITTR